jgi:simple sugar transport system ATP-binding protein
MTTPIIECRGLQKWYSGVHALKNVNLTILPGEVVGLVGDNGAGKSTLIKILSGVHRQDAGEVLIEGKPADIRTPKDAMRYGLETIYQYNSMVPTMSIARNLFIGREPMKWSIGGFGVMDQKRMRAESVKAIADVDLHLRSPDALVGELSGGQKQGVAIARAMHFKSKVLILDEPTNHLSVKETDKVIGFVKGLKGQGSPASSFRITCITSSNRATVSSRWRAARSFSIDRRPRRLSTKCMSCCEGAMRISLRRTVRPTGRRRQRNWRWRAPSERLALAAPACCCLTARSRDHR